MFKVLSTSEKLASGVSALVLATLALLACLKLRIAPSYPDFIVGSISWRAETKLQDILAVPVFIVALLYGFYFFNALITKQNRQYPSEYSSKFIYQLIGWSLPAMAAIFSLILKTGFDYHLLCLSAMGIAFMAISVSYKTSNNIKVSPELLSQGIFAIMLIGLIPLEFDLVGGRISARLFGNIDILTYEIVFLITIIFGFIAGLFNARYRPNQFIRWLPRLLLVGQFSLATLFLSIYPAKLLQPNGVVAWYQTTWWLKAIIIAMILGTMFDVIRRYRKYSSRSTDQWMRLLSPLAFVALLVALRVGNTIAPAINPDDYHFGENLVGYWSYLQGAIPYVDYLPAHGLIDDDMRGLLSSLFYDGSAASIEDTGRLYFALLAVIGFMSLYRFTDSILLAFVSIFFVYNDVVMGAGFKWMFFIPFLCFWLSPRLIANPARWLSVWILTAPIVILGVPAQGCLLVAASSVMAVYMAWMFLKNIQQRKWKGIFLALGIVCILSLGTPLIPMLMGALRYVIENGPINQIAYGVAWKLSWNQNFASSGLLFEAVRTSWIVIPIICMGTIIKRMKDPENLDKAISAMVILAFSLLLIPYSMGRIDPGGFSRPGIYSMFAWAILLPMVLWGSLKPRLRAPLILLMVIISSLLTVLPFRPVQNFLSAMSAQIGTGPLKDGRSVGMPNMGIAHVQDEHWNGLVKLNELLNKKLSPGQPYLDLTGRHAQYFHTNRKPVIEVTAPYNMVSLKQQARTVSKLAIDLPKIALLHSSTYNIHNDGGGLGLRNHYLYRFIIDHYIPHLEDGFIIGIKKPIAIKDRDSTQLSMDPESLLEYRALLFQKSFLSSSNLERIPLAWGRSLKSLNKKMIPVKKLDEVPPSVVQLIPENGSYTVNGIDPQLRFDISSFGLSGHDTGLLKLDFSCINKQAVPIMQVFWWGDNRTEPFEASSLKLTAGNGTLIIPLDSFPLWLTLKNIKGIRIDLDNASACSAFSIKNIELLQRVSISTLPNDEEK